MRTYIFWILFILQLFLSSCESTRGVINKKPSYTIDLDKIPKKDNEFFSTLFKSAGIIVLETTDNSLLTKVDKVDCLNDFLFVLERGNGVFLFNKSGKFIKRIGKKGSGPGEYISPADMTLDLKKQKLYLLDSQTQRILKYSISGAYETSFKIKNEKTFSNRILYFNNKIYTNLYSPGEDENRFLLSKVDIPSGDRTTFWLEARQYSEGWNEKLNTSQHPFIDQYSSNPKFLQLFMNTIFEIREDGLQPYITIESTHLVTEDFLNSQSSAKSPSEIFSELNHSDRIYSISNYIESSNYIYFNYFIGESLYIVLYDKMKKSAFITQGMKNDLLYTNNSGPQLFPNFISTDGTRVYSVEMYDNFSRDMFMRDVQLGRISSKTKGFDRLKEISEDSNPIIVYYELKD